MTHDAAAYVVQTAKVIRYLPREYILHKSVHGEITSLRGFFLSEKGIYLDVKIPVASACEPLSARHGDIQIAALQPEYSKARSHIYSMSETVQNAA